jgi:O-antigen/teichoic acid export membrane protein
MNTVQRIAKNTCILLAANIISRILSFFYIMYTARYLGAEGFGILSFALAFTGIFGVFADLGLGQLTIREVTRDKSLVGKYLVNISMMKLILVTITFGLIALTINLLGYPGGAIKVVYLVALSVILGAFTGMLNSIFQAFERMEYHSLGQILNSFLMLVGVIFAIKYSFSIVGFAFLYFIVSLIVLGYSLLVLRWKFFNSSLAWAPLKVGIDWSFWKSTIKEALPFGLAAIFTTIYFWIDTVMLSLMKGDDVVGWYNAAYRLIFVLMLIPTAVVSSIFPVISRLYVSSKNSVRLAYEISFKYLLIIGLPIAVGTTILADRIILLIYGKEFSHSIIALQILIWVALLMFLTYLLGNTLGAVDKQRKVLQVTGIGAVVNVVLNLLLIPRLSYVGASIVTVATEGVVFVLLFYFVSKYLHRIPLPKYIMKPLLASSIMGVSVFYLEEISLLGSIPIAIFIYFTVLYFIRTISQEDINLFMQISGRRPK